MNEAAVRSEGAFSGDVGSPCGIVRIAGATTTALPCLDDGDAGEDGARWLSSTPKAGDLAAAAADDDALFWRQLRENVGGASDGSSDYDSPRGTVTPPPLAAAYDGGDGDGDGDGCYGLLASSLAVPAWAAAALLGDPSSEHAGGGGGGDGDGDDQTAFGAGIAVHAPAGRATPAKLPAEGEDHAQHAQHAAACCTLARTVSDLGSINTRSGTVLAALFDDLDGDAPTPAAASAGAAAAADIVAAAAVPAGGDAPVAPASDHGNGASPPPSPPPPPPPPALMGPPHKRQRREQPASAFDTPKTDAARLPPLPPPPPPADLQRSPQLFFPPRGARAGCCAAAPPFAGGAHAGAACVWGLPMCSIVAPGIARPL